jgi:phospholipid transport system substrate-binding protein
VGRKWWDFSKKQKKEFVELFRQLLENTYLKRIENHADATVKYVGAEEDDGYWTVKIVAISRDNQEVPITYKMYTLSEKEKKKKDAEHHWLIYDVKIEGVSLVNNYRSQFRDILLGHSIDELIAKLRKKVQSKKD